MAKNIEIITAQVEVPFHFYGNKQKNKKARN